MLGDVLVAISAAEPKPGHWIPRTLTTITLDSERLGNLSHATDDAAVVLATVFAVRDTSHA